MSAKVPVLNPARMTTRFWEIVGQIISHAFILHHIFPIQLSLAYMCTLLSNKCTDEILQASFTHYLCEQDRLAITTARTDFVSAKQRLVNIFAANGGLILPSPSNYRQQLLQMANVSLLVKPFYAMMQMKHGFSVHGELWQGWNEQVCRELYRSLRPTTERVTMSITYGFSDNVELRVSEERTKDFLENFLLALTEMELEQMLTFWSSTPLFVQTSTLHVEFNSTEGLVQRPTANTCSSTLTLSRQYMSQKEFNENLKVCLNPDLLVFDTM